MDKDQFQVLQEQISNLQKTLDRKIRDDEEVTAEYQQVNIRLGALEGVVEEMRKQMTTLSKRVGDRVEDAVQPVLDQTQDLKDTIDKKKMIAIEEQKLKKKPWWQILRR